MAGKTFARIALPRILVKAEKVGRLKPDPWNFLTRHQFFVSRAPTKSRGLFLIGKVKKVEKPEKTGKVEKIEKSIKLKNPIMR